jgi:hypothetical protein
MIRNANQRIQMVREAQYRWKRRPRIRQLSRTLVLHLKQRIERVFNRHDIVCGYHDRWYSYSHIFGEHTPSAKKPVSATKSQLEKKERTTSPHNPIPLRTIHQRRRTFRDGVISVPSHVRRVRDGRVNLENVNQRVSMPRIDGAHLVCVCACVPDTIEEVIYFFQQYISLLAHTHTRTTIASLLFFYYLPSQLKKPV